MLFFGHQFAIDNELLIAEKFFFPGKNTPGSFCILLGVSLLML